MTWFLRQGGRVTGPHSEEELLGKIKVNLIRSMDEVSADGAVWKRVKFTELWRPPEVPTARGGNGGEGLRLAGANGETIDQNSWMDVGEGKGNKETRRTGFLEAWKRGWSRWSWSGRASRSEYWWRAVSVWLEIMALWALGVVLGSILDAIGVALWFLLFTVYFCLSAFPNFCMTIRRLHDIGKEGLYVLVSFIPFVGGIILLVWMCRPGDAGPNAFGEEPN